MIQTPLFYRDVAQLQDLDISESDSQDGLLSRDVDQFHDLDISDFDSQDPDPFKEVGILSHPR